MQSVLLYLSLLFTTTTFPAQFNSEVPLVKMNYNETCHMVILDERTCMLIEKKDALNNVITFNSIRYFSRDILYCTKK